jgi:amidase
MAAGTMLGPMLATMVGLAATGAALAQAKPSDPVVERSIDEIAGITSVAATRASLDRIEALDRKGPALHAVIATNADAIAQAEASDARRTAGKLFGLLDGIPVLIKDNVETRDMPTTAGSLALAANATGRDAAVVARLRAAGAVILGKANLSEWANIRSSRSMSGWSAVGGLVRNPYALDRTVCGSSSGSAAAVAASMAVVAIGTETNGSVTCPASMTGIVGLKPTVGMVSRTHIVPISHSQDTAGPMGRSVRDVAILFSAMVGSDPADPATARADGYRRDFAAALSPGALRGVKVGVRRPDLSPDLAAVYDHALAQLKAAGAVLIEVPAIKTDIDAAEMSVLLTELKVDLDAYLATTPPAVKTRTLDQVIAFDTAQAAQEMPYFEQELFLKSAQTKGLADPAYRAARAKARGAAVAAIDGMLKANGVSLLVEPTYGAAWLSDPVHGDQFTGPSAADLPAIAGYPHLTVPMGRVRGLPVGLSFVGPAWSDGALLASGYAFEQQARARVAPGFAATVAVQ